ncbi:MATE family efflux transporter [Enterococcus sp. HY326]|uniref:MATE family efflux transporter n=1 Tax=Enterococcus sp. HY326 TaxID=2971265 RepID=UPI00223F77CB|nr:MATE family efflux transporter [Enterococcus sp. HY326]
MKKIIVELNKFALPLLAGNIMQVVIGQLALAFAGNLSYENIPAITTMTNFLFSVTGILGVIAVAFNMISSKALGEKNTEKFQHLVSSIICLSLLIGGAAIGILLLGSSFILKTLYHFEGELFSIAQAYLFSMSPYILLVLLSFALTNLIKVERKTNYILVVSIISSIIQAFLSYVLINGAFFFPNLGIVGAGLSEMIALFVSVILYLLLVRKMLFAALKTKPTEIKHILKRATPLMFQEILEGVLFIIVFEALISRIGVLALTTYSLLMQGINYAKMPTFMYSNSLFVFISEAHGEKNNKKVQQNMLGASSLSVFFYVLIAGLLIAGYQPFGSLFTTDAQVVENFGRYVSLGCLAIFTTVFYENIKATLVSLEKEKLVLLATTIVNGIAIIALILLSYLDLLSFSQALIIYGVNYFILDGVFLLFYRNEITRDKSLSA